ncbi:hypothetical protein EON64_16770, partial [archaeon]
MRALLGKADPNSSIIYAKDDTAALTSFMDMAPNDSFAHSLSTINRNQLTLASSLRMSTNNFLADSLAGPMSPSKTKTPSSKTKGRAHFHPVITS